MKECCGYSRQKGVIGCRRDVDGSGSGGGLGCTLGYLRGLSQADVGSESRLIALYCLGVLLGVLQDLELGFHQPRLILSLSNFFIPGFDLTYPLFLSLIFYSTKNKMVGNASKEENKACLLALSHKTGGGAKK